MGRQGQKRNLSWALKNVLILNRQKGKEREVMSAKGKVAGM